MKKLITLFVFMAFTLVIMAQAPGKMSYQALVRDSNNKLIPDSNIGMQISILQSSAEGTALYVERHFPSTNSNGLVTVEIGGGTIVSGDIIGIDWANGPYFIKTETDLNGGANYTISGTSQLLSVPYSLHSNTAENVITENDPVFGASAASGITNTNISNWNNKLDSEVDGSITNELQTLSLTGKTLSISSKNSVELPFFELTNNSIGSQHIINGTIKNEDVSATANIDISKILGTSGVAFSFPTTFKSWSNGTYQIQTLTTITMDIPKDGHVFKTENLNMHETAVAWADITIKVFEDWLEKLHANYSYQLTDSFVHHIHTAANGNPEMIDFAYKYYGKFVDMGVGGNVDLDNRDAMVSAGLTTRRQKPWFSKTFFYQVRRIGEILSEKYAQKGAITIVANIDDNAERWEKRWERI
jgi:hypothetical protein